MGNASINLQQHFIYFFNRWLARTITNNLTKENNMDNNEIEINGETFVKKSAINLESFNAKNTEGLPYVICRGYYCGVHAGYLKEHDGNHVTLINSRRLWQWKANEGISLSAVAKHGIANDCDLPNELSEIWLGDVYEVIPCTEVAMNSIIGAEVHEQE